MKDREEDGPVLVSACLVGLCTRYDGRAAADPQAAERADGRILVPICPEQLGGLPTPRPRSRIAGGSGEEVLDGVARVTSELGADVTANFLAGARAAVEVARLVGARKALLKERSPSCGVTELATDGGPRPGRGVAAALLAREGIEIEGI